MIVKMFQKNSFLKSDEVKTGDLVKFLDEGVEEESKKFVYPELTQSGKPHPMAGLPKKQFQIKVEIGGGDQRVMTLNATSFRQLAEKWGGDTVHWINKMALITLVPLPSGKKMISLTPEE